MWLRLSIVLIVGGAFLTGIAQPQQKVSPGKSRVRSEPKYDQTFAGPIIELTATKITVSRSILGRPPEKRTFWIKSDTRVEGKLRMRAKVTVGFVTTQDGDIARLVVVRTQRKRAKK